MKCYSLFYSSTCLPRTIAEVLPSLKCYLFVVQLYVLPASSVTSLQLYMLPPSCLCIHITNNKNNSRSATSLQLSMLPPSAAEVSPCYHHQQPKSLHVTKNNSRSITQPQVLPSHSYINFHTCQPNFVFCFGKVRVALKRAGKT